MVRILIVNLCLISVLIIAVKAQNYCASNLCPNGLKHIACRNSGSFSKRCPRNRRMVSLKRYRSLILKMFNSKRNLIASGRMPRYQAARRMATIQWNNELAKIAALNVKQCRMQHDKCRNTKQFSRSGQNLAMISYSGKQNKLSTKFLIRNRVNAWWNEYKNANMRYIKTYPQNYNGPAIGHFTIYVAERNVRLGCAAVRFRTGQNNNFLIACNFATTNIVGKSIYKSGRAGSRCRTGRNRVYKNLCSIKEKYSGL